jgi:hypothetical protein
MPNIVGGICIPQEQHKPAMLWPVSLLAPRGTRPPRIWASDQASPSDQRLHTLVRQFVGNSAGMDLLWLSNKEAQRPNFILRFRLSHPYTIASTVAHSLGVSQPVHYVSVIQARDRAINSMMVIGSAAKQLLPAPILRDPPKRQMWRLLCLETPHLW